ncbi:Ancient ubiquitous protein 1 [Lamellibrachia satsuma]|nr:Ancient ubiquitous protein 1 [Lamellibrachia satsuma]
MSQDEDETVEEFAQRVQQTMSEALNIKATAHTSSDKVEYAKQILFVQPQTAIGQSNEYSTNAPQRANSSSSSSSSNNDLMVRQVQEVLPHVPQDAIRKDLALTKDVDLTITNILEGRVQFNPVAPSVNEPVTASPANTTMNSSERTTLSSPCQVASKMFQRSSQQRHLSLQDRKKLLIETARQRYLENHCGRI